MTDMSELYDEFVSNIDRKGGPNSCHVWTGKTEWGGYGYWRGKGAHRFAYALKNGTIPDGAVVRHKCDNPICCNPSHLEIGTHADNRKDCVERGRHARGQNHPHSKLSHSDVRFIRTHHKGWSHSKIAEKYGVSRSTITKILNWQTYPDVAKRVR